MEHNNDSNGIALIEAETQKPVGWSPNKKFFAFTGSNVLLAIAGLSIAQNKTVNQSAWVPSNTASLIMATSFCAGLTMAVMALAKYLRPTSKSHSSQIDNSNLLTGEPSTTTTSTPNQSRCCNKTTCSNITYSTSSLLAAMSGFYGGALLNQNTHVHQWTHDKTNLSYSVSGAAAFFGLVTLISTLLISDRIVASNSNTDLDLHDASDDNDYEPTGNTAA